MFRVHRKLKEENAALAERGVVPSRVVVWYSCGRSSAVAAKLAIERWGDRVIVAYNASVASSEHPDNARFITDCERWYGRPIQRLYSTKYKDIWDVFERTRWLVGVRGARCTTELKKVVRHKFQRLDDLQVFGFGADELRRVERFRGNNFEILSWFPLVDEGLTGYDCGRLLLDVGIELPAMYRMGYHNNNCIGCVKGGSGYWNKIRVDFPDVFARMAKVERDIGAAICKRQPIVNGVRQRIPVYLDELQPGVGRYSEEPAWECGVGCAPQLKSEASNV